MIYESTGQFTLNRLIERGKDAYSNLQKLQFFATLALSVLAAIKGYFF